MVSFLVQTEETLAYIILPLMCIHPQQHLLGVLFLSSFEINLHCGLLGFICYSNFGLIFEGL